MSRAAFFVRGAAIAALLSFPIRAQEIQASGAQLGHISRIAANDTEFRLIWEGADPAFCGGSWVDFARPADPSGGFPIPYVQVPESCLAAQYADIAVLPTGVSIASFHDGANDVHVRVFDPAMNPLAPEAIVNLDTSGNPERDERVAAVGADRFVVVWANYVQQTVYGRVVMADGTMPALPVVLASGAPGNHTARVGALASGDVVVAWLRGVSPLEVIARIYDRDLGALSSEMKLNQAQPAGPFWLELAAAGSTYAATWHRWESGPGSDSDVVVRFFDHAAGPMGGEIVVNETTADNQFDPAIALDPSGRAAITWLSYQDLPVRPYLRRFDASGVPLEGEYTLGIQDEGGGWPDVAMLPSGDFVAAWSGGGTGGTIQVLTRRFFFPVSLAVAPGPGSGNAPRIAVVRPDGSPGYPAFVPYGSGGYGAQVGAGDIDADGLAEVLGGPGPSPSYGPQVRGFERDGSAIAKVNFYAYGTLRFGVKPRTADLDGDAIDEILTTPGPGPPFGPHVRAFDFDGGPLSAIAKVSFFAFSTLQYGANGSGAELDRDGFDEMLVAPGPGPSFAAQVKGVDYDGTSVRAMGKVNFYAFTAASHGATLAAADVESDGRGSFRDGYDEIAAGHGPGAAFDGEIRLYDYDANRVWQKHAEPDTYGWLHGIELAGGDVDDGDSDEIVSAPGPDPAAASRVLCWDWSYIPSRGSDLAIIGPDDFVAFPGTYGGHAAVGRFD